MYGCECRGDCAVLRDSDTCIQSLAHFTEHLPSYQTRKMVQLSSEVFSACPSGRDDGLLLLTGCMFDSSQSYQGLHFAMYLSLPSSHDVRIPTSDFKEILCCVSYIMDALVQ